MNRALPGAGELLRDEALFNKKVAYEQIVVYCRDTKPTFVSAVLLTIGLALFFSGQVSARILLPWVTYQFTVHLYRYLNVRAFEKTPPGGIDTGKWLKKARFAALLVGIGYGALNLVLSSSLPEEYKILTACALPAICGISVSVGSILPGFYPVFMLPVMVPFLVVNILPGTSLGYGLSLFGLLFILSLLSTSKRVYASTELALRISLQNLMLRELADEASRAKSDFLSSVSHELRTPMTSVYGFAKLIKKKLDRLASPGPDSDDAKRSSALEDIHSSLDIIVTESERLTKLINDVLDLAKLDAGRAEMDSSPVDLKAVIDHAAIAISPLAAQKNLELIIDVAEGSRTVRGDRDRLIQVVLNLVSNAVKFTERGSVTIRARVEGEVVKVSVIDTGIGISQENHGTVFDKFHQIGDTLTEKPKGTGLGLPICKEIVERHGGRIWVESRLGQGASFIFTIPAIEQSQIR